MKHRCEHKTDVGFGNTLSDLFRSRVDFHSQLNQNISRAALTGYCPVSVLCHIRPGSCRHQCCRCRYVKCFDSGATGAAGVYHIVYPCLDWYRMVTQRACQTGDFLGGCPFHSHHCQKRRDLHFRYTAFEDGIQQRPGLVKAQVFAVQNDFQIFSYICHCLLPALFPARCYGQNIGDYFSSCRR